MQLLFQHINLLLSSEKDGTNLFQLHCRKGSPFSLLNKIKIEALKRWGKMTMPTGDSITSKDVNSNLAHFLQQQRRRQGYTSLFFQSLGCRVEKSPLTLVMDDGWNRSRGRDRYDADALFYRNIYLHIKVSFHTIYPSFFLNSFAPLVSYPYTRHLHAIFLYDDSAIDNPPLSCQISLLIQLDATTT